MDNFVSVGDHIINVAHVTHATFPPIAEDDEVKLDVFFLSGEVIRLEWFEQVQRMCEILVTREAAARRTR